MASATELFNIGSQVDPYGKFREAQLAPMQYDIKQANLEEQLKEIRQDQEAQKQQQPGLGTMAGGATMPSGGLSGMAKTINPNWKLVDDDGMPTTAGQINDFTLQSIEEGKAGAKLMKQAKFMEPGSKDQINTISEGRRLLNNSMAYRTKATELARNTQNDAIYAAATAKDQAQWDNAIKSYQASGLPLPQGIPTEFTPENVKKIAQLAPAALQSKISNDLLKQRQEDQEAVLRDLTIKKKIAAEREGAGDGLGGKEFKDVRGQLQGLRNWLPDNQIKNLGAKEVPAVSARLEAAELTDELAHMAAKNSKATGLVSSFFQNFERFLPDRYDAETSGESVGQRINSEIEKMKASGKYTKDDISEARLIAKKAVDVINARALAASGGNRILVSELRLQKDVLGLDKLTPKSAPYVYSELAESDRKALKRFGIDTSTIKRSFEPIKPEDTAEPKAGPTNFKAEATKMFGSYEPKKYRYGKDEKGFYREPL